MIHSGQKAPVFCRKVNAKKKSSVSGRLSVRYLNVLFVFAEKRFRLYVVRIDFLHDGPELFGFGDVFCR